MEVTFRNSKLQKLCNSDKKLRLEYGARMALLIQQRLSKLDGAETLEDMKFVVGSHCHELTGNLKGLLSVCLVHPDRLAFRPTDKPIPLKPDGGLDWGKIKSVEVVGIGDYH